MSDWDVERIGPMKGKIVIVTGGNSGLGFESVKALSASGAQVIMASRNPNKAQAAKAEILAAHPDAQIETYSLDLASLASVHAFVANFRNRHERLDVLMNNAGVMAIPRQETEDGFERQFGTNHLGHFALTGMLLERLLETPDSRVVIVTSLAADFGRIRFSDLMYETGYSRWVVYCQSKLANMLFGLELQRRLRAAGRTTICVLAHPGFSSTNLQKGPAVGGGLLGSTTEKVIRVFCQSQADGALPQLYASTEPGLSGGEYIGPDGFNQMKGKPVQVRLPRTARGSETAQRLWQASVELTGIDFSALQS